MNTKNILFLGYYYGKSGWSQAARRYLRALTKTGHNIAARHVYMAKDIDVEYSGEEFKEFENNRFKHYDVVIQNVLPHLSIYDKRFGKNIAICCVETNHIEHTRWPRHLNLMDEIWVPSTYDIKYLQDSGCNRPIHNIPIPIDLDRFQYNNFVKSKDAPFTFYFIGEYIDRKNIQALILAYLCEFTKRDNVQLIIKTNRYDGPTNFDDEINNYINDVKDNINLNLNKNNYPPIKVITEYITNDEINTIHNISNCFVMPSHGESFCIPAVEALAFGNSVITTNNIGLCDFINSKNGWKVKSSDAIVHSSHSPLANIYTGREVWKAINTVDLKNTLRQAYIKNKKPIDCMKSIINLSYDAIAQQINKII